MGDSGQVWLKLTQWFQRKFKCMTDAMFWQIKAHMAFENNQHFAMSINRTYFFPALVQIKNNICYNWFSIQFDEDIDWTWTHNHTFLLDICNVS
jgi:hypothetical protein